MRKNIKKKKNEKKEILWMLVALVSLAVITLGVSVAFFNYTKEGITENTVTSGTITFLYTEISGIGKGIQISDAYPMTDEQGMNQTGIGKYFDFKITSQTASTISIPYEVTARKSSDSTLDDQVVKLYLTELNGDDEKEILLENYSKLQQTGQETATGYTEKTIYTDKVPAKQSNYEKNFRLRMWIDEKTDFSGKEEETGNVTYPYNGKTFTVTVNVYSNGKVVSNIPTGTLKSTNSSHEDLIWGYRDSITKIVFENELHEIPNSISFDISEEGNGSVMSYLVLNDDKETYTAYLQGNGGIKANVDSRYLFYKFINLKTIENLEYLDTSQVTDMRYMFSDCNNLTSLDVSQFDTSQVKNMRYMFHNCNNLESLDVSHFNTSQVTDMDHMFYGCNNLTNLDLNHFDTSQVTSMKDMFNHCENLTSLNLSHFDTSQVTDMSYMFSNCNNLESLDVSQFDTSQVKNMRYMFYSCQKLTSLDVGHFDTSQVTNMSSMFSNCNNLESLDLSQFNTSQVTDMSYMFSFCRNLTSLNLSQFNTTQVKNMEKMFYSCNNLINLNLSSFDTSQVTDMISMFDDCSKLTTTITITTNSCSYNWMFRDAATESGSKITVNFTSSNSDLVARMIATKSAKSTVVKGSQIY